MTYNELKKQAFDAIIEQMIVNRDEYRFCCATSTEVEIWDAIRDNAPGPQELVYIYEAWQIVCSSDLDEAEDVDLSHCKNAYDAVMEEANGKIRATWYRAISEAASEIADMIADACEAAAELGFDGDISLSRGSRFGWTPHNRETEMGTAIYDDKPGFYHPHLVEGELYAVEAGIGGGVYAGACWS
jgi:hypothetical protein